MTDSSAPLEDTIALVASQAGHQGIRLTRTKLVKLLYFIDLRAWQQIGRTVTGAEWRWHHYGPYSASIVEACGRMAAAGELDVEATENWFGTPEYRISSAEEMYYRPPSEELVRLVRSVIADLGRYPPARIGDLSYETEPMRRLIAKGQRGDLIEFVSPSPSRADSRRVVDRYAKLVRTGEGETTGEVADGLRAESAALSDARRSASRRLLVEG